MPDIALRDDDCRVRAKNAAEVMNILRETGLTDTKDLRHMQMWYEEQA